MVSIRYIWKLKHTNMSMEIANTIRQQLMGLGKIKVWSWGANSWAGGENFLRFKVQGFKFKGFVKITLTPMDVYQIEFIKRNGEVVKTCDMVYFDEMVDIIDNFVETNDGKYTKAQEKENDEGLGRLIN